jgi:hypothetical protein
MRTLITAAVVLSAAVPRFAAQSSGSSRGITTMRKHLRPNGFVSVVDGFPESFRSAF